MELQNSLKVKNALDPQWNPTPSPAPSGNVGLNTLFTELDNTHEAQCRVFTDIEEMLVRVLGANSPTNFSVSTISAAENKEMTLNDLTNKVKAVLKREDSKYHRLDQIREALGLILFS